MQTNTKRANQPVLFRYDPSKVVKLVGEEVASPRHLDDQEEQTLVATVTETGSLRDKVCGKSQGLRRESS